MARNGDSKRDGRTPQRVYRSSDMHKRRVGKETRRDTRDRMRRTAQDQREEAVQAENARQEQFRIIHGGRYPHKERDLADIPRVIDDADGYVADGRSAELDDDHPARMRPVVLTFDASSQGRPVEAADERAQEGCPSETPDGLEDAENPAAGKQHGTGAGAAITVLVSDGAGEGLQDGEGKAHEEAGDTGDSEEQAQSEALENAEDTVSDSDKAAGEAFEEAYDDEEFSEEPPKKPRRTRRTILIIIASIVGVVLILFGLFCWNRWLRYDDTVEIQGEWFAAYSGRRAPIVIDSDTITFNAETKWHYTLDTTAKTITFTFGSQTGGGRYRFADGHEHLIIEDGIDFTAFDTFMADLQLVVSGRADEIPQGDTVTVLSRSADAVVLPDDVATDSSPVAEKPRQTEGAASSEEVKEPAESSNGAGESTGEENAVAQGDAEAPADNAGGANENQGRTGENRAEGENA